MAHMVKCSVCGKQFDRDKIQAVKSGARRYAHYSCKPDGEKVDLPQVDEDLLKLTNYAEQLLGKDYNAARVKKQIKDFKEEYNYSYSGMLKSLVYFYEIKGNSTEKANGGIGIIPYVYKDASEYYYSIYLAQIANRDKKIEEHKLKINTFNIESPRTFVKKPKLFNIDSVEDDK